MGVAIVSFQSADIIAECLSSLAATRGVRLKIVVCDNASSDATLQVIRDWAAERGEGFTFEEAECGAIAQARADLTLLRAPVNGGFAYGTNRCLEILAADPAIGLFWLVNPDARVLPDTALHFARAGADGQFALMGGRTLFAERPGIVQTDGGRVSRWTGRCQSVNWGKGVGEAAMPDAASLDFITGANCVASRRFLEQSGLMREEYFLYYEEVDWALSRGDLPLRTVPEAHVLHIGGTAIGSRVMARGASPFASYFSYRNRRRMMRRYWPWALPLSMGHALLKALHCLLRRSPDGAWAVFTGMFGLAPPAKVRARLTQGAQELAFGKGTL